MVFTNKLLKRNHYIFSLPRSQSNPKREIKLDFLNLQKDFYEDLISYDGQIKEQKETLKRIKIKGIKESIYSHRPIPCTWKKRLDYFQSLYQTMNDDKDFVSYLGCSPIKNTTNEVLPELPKTNIRPLFQRTKLPFTKDLSSSANNTARSSILHKRSSLFKGGCIRQNEDNQYKINEILEEYSTNFPLNIPIERVDHSPVVINKPIKKNKNNPMHLSKSQVFKSTIYSNLMNDHGSLFKQKLQQTQSSKNIIQQRKKTSQNYGLFLNFDYESFNKINEIANPEIKKQLIDINYYGPYFSHCRSCKNKNIDFYNTMNRNQCFELLSHLRKERLKSQHKY